MSNKNRVVLTLALCSVFALLLGWLALHPRSATGLSGNTLFIAASIVLSITPIYPLYRSMREMPPAAVLAVLLVIGALISGLIYIVGSWVLHIDARWLSALMPLNEGLIISSSALFIWVGLRHRAK
jgi:hypothetical protein